MKKLITAFLAVVMIAALPLQAFADSTGMSGATGNNSATIAVNGIYSSGAQAQKTVSVDVAWGAMNFTYSTTGTWDPNEHKYVIDEEGKWSIDEGANEITITNHSNVAVMADLSFTSTNETLETSFDDSTLYLDSAESGTAPEASTHFNITGGSITEKADQLGTISVAISLLNIDATNLSADELNTRVAAALEQGCTDITVTLAATPGENMFYAIRRALVDTENVADGSITLTLAGVTAIPDDSDIDSKIFCGMFQKTNETGEAESLANVEYVQELCAVNLPDVVTIGKSAFSHCKNLTSVYAPKVEKIGMYAFEYTALTSLDFPALKTVSTGIVNATTTLRSAKLPSVTTLEATALLIGAAFLTALGDDSFTLELTAAGTITFAGSNHFNVGTQSYSNRIDLVLNIDKQDKVTYDTDGNPVWNSYTFKSITFVSTEATE